MGFFDRGKGPVASAKGGTGNFGRENTDGPGNMPVDYGKGPPGRKSQKEIWDMLMEKWGPSPWFAAGAQMPWSGPDGQERGQRAPRFTPDAGDPRNAGYWKNQSTPEEIAADNAAAKARYAKQQDLLGGDAAYTAAKGAGDLKGQIAAMTALKQRMQQQRFLDQGGSAQTWNDRFKTEWPVPKSPLGTETRNPNGGGAPAPTGGGDRALPPAANPMMEGYQPSGNDVIAALSRIQSLPIGAPTAASNAQGGFAKAASTTKPKAPTMVRRGGGRVDRAA